MHIKLFYNFIHIYELNLHVFPKQKNNILYFDYPNKSYYSINTSDLNNFFYLVYTTIQKHTFEFFPSYTITLNKTQNKNSTPHTTKSDFRLLSEMAACKLQQLLWRIRERFMKENLWERPAIQQYWVELSFLLLIY